ncbi:hypothetical protein CC85DRAFT_286029 [Cutaneotrichosporon oleaginosum]|uniref:Uncharacterized protein n=1 Tax=Cutaneotrichosporon oleaginosum TaxID=879819 RepID=A0A0J1B2W8_9TREE|nr:uncharacterized protein CC85DRAFT_286029 [Cutaneotrichosporon oleaginosum]KLT41944.1 hypothetical protein CC85DRAFT_286029 [Cutaneotrichosporon oleaginosum]TXT12543.1 hypothetical protein COLE_02953 [Cutaneotrichosporon oleaginosum]
MAQGTLAHLAHASRAAASEARSLEQLAWEVDCGVSGAVSHGGRMCLRRLQSSQRASSTASPPKPCDLDVNDKSRRPHPASNPALPVHVVP